MPERLGRNGLDNRQRILDAMIELTHQNVPMLIRATSLGHVSCDLGRAENPSLDILERRDGQ